MADDVDPDAERERYRELLEELRTIIPGVQVLLAFLLTVPFSSRFDELDELGRDIYAVVLTGVALATIVLMTPAAFHRLSDERDRTRRLRIGIRCTISGITLLAACVVASVFVVVRFVFDDVRLATTLAGVVTAAVVGLWYVLSLRHPDGG